MDNDINRDFDEAPKDPGLQDNQRYTEQDYEGNVGWTKSRIYANMTKISSIINIIDGSNLFFI